WVAARAMALAASARRGPVHVNVPLHEPLVPAVVEPAPDLAYPHAEPRMPAGPGARQVEALAQVLSRARRGLIVSGPHDGGPPFAAAVRGLANRLGWPVLADGCSPLRSAVPEAGLWTYDSLLRAPAFAASHLPDVVVRFGATPTSKALGDLIASPAIERSVLVDPEGAWNDPAQRSTDVVAADEEAFCRALTEALPSAGGPRPWLEDWLSAEKRAAAAIGRALATTDELFEGRVFTELAGLLPAGATLYVGNSMPVRDLDSFFPAGTGVRVLANRGANGIDGLLSSGLGAAAVAAGPVVIVLGDLSLLHDIGGLAAVQAAGLRATVVLLNNDGGGIFSFLAQARLPEEGFERLFGTPHGLDFSIAARLFGLAHARVADWAGFREEVRRSLNGSGASMIEVRTDRRTNVTQHQAVWAHVAATSMEESS
ncbi:MAG: 2-succinyl-5-enolpyruvyl-6-hydroxy-3-cyclohexene-1-carboxylic-acid synthase, partial [Deltaproteobacteria bacterium]|nr:2-succinyl-5-enolpyruvyl-6-hydroxy-3-cyclohexene-1-carboxylic-acid synthase [Deltaproteobacteria bacterium]